MADLQQETQKMNLAMEYTNGDLELAKKMISGAYKDVFLVKGRAEMSGAMFVFFLLHFHQKEERILDAYFLATTERQAEHTKIFQPAVSLCKSLTQIADAGKEDFSTKSMFGNAFAEALQTSVGSEIIKSVQKRDIGNVTKLFNFIIASKLEVQKPNLQIEIEEMSSYEWHFKNYTEGKLAPFDLNVKQEAAPVQSHTDFMETPDIKNFEGRYDRVIDSDVVLSPVKGKLIREIMPGQKIKVILPTSDPSQLAFAKTRGAVSEEGEVVPIGATFRRFVPVPGNEGFIIYADLPGKVLCRAFEESMGVKLATMDAKAGSAPAKSGSSLPKAVAKASKEEGSGPLVAAGVGVGVLIIILVWVFSAL